MTPRIASARLLNAQRRAIDKRFPDMPGVAPEITERAIENLHGSDAAQCGGDKYDQALDKEFARLVKKAANKASKTTSQGETK